MVVNGIFQQGVIDKKIENNKTAHNTYITL